MSKHNSIIKKAIKSICSVALSRIFVGKAYCKLISKHLLRGLFWAKLHFFLNAFRRMRPCMRTIFGRYIIWDIQTNLQVAAWNYKSFIAIAFDGNTLKMKTTNPVQVIKNKEYCFQLFPNGTHFGFARFSFSTPDRTRNLNQTPGKSGAMKLNLSRPYV